MKFLSNLSKIISVIIYVLLMGTLTVDIFTHKALDTLNYKWWTIFLLLEIWFAIAIEKKFNDK